MRTTTKRVCEAFIAGKSRKVNNTETDGKTLTLFGNKIAEKNDDGSYTVTLAGHPTVTTRERLNGLCDMLGLGRPFYQHKNRQFFNTDEIGEDDDIKIRSEACPV